MVGQLLLVLEKEKLFIWLSIHISDVVVLSQQQQRPVCGMAWTDSRKNTTIKPGKNSQNWGREGKKTKYFHYSHPQSEVKKIIQS